MTLCNQYAMSRCIPKCYWDKPNDVLVVIQLGRALNVPDILMLQNSYVIDNRPSIMTQLMLALAMQSPAWDESAYKLEWVGEPDDLEFKAIFTCRRKGGQLVAAEFSARDAKRANLANVHKTYPKDMLGWRAMSRGLRRAFADMLGGLCTVEEMRHAETVRQAVDAVDLETTDQLRASMSITTEPQAHTASPPPSIDDVTPEPEPTPEPKPAKKSKPDLVTGSEAITLRMTIENHLKRLSPEETKIAFSKVGIADATRLQFMDVDALNGLLELVKPAQ